MADAGVPGSGTARHEEMRHEEMHGCVLIGRSRAWTVIRGSEIIVAQPSPQLTSPAVRPLRGLGVQGVGSPQHPDQHAERCEACALARSGAASGVGSRLAGATVTVGTDVVVISGPQIAGRVIVPRQHIGGLEELSLPRRAQVLAAIRRAAAVVGTGEPQTPARVVASTDSPGSASHVCFHVLPPDDTAPRDRRP